MSQPHVGIVKRGNILRAWLLCFNFMSSYALVKFPDSARVESQMIFIGQDEYEIYMIEENIDKLDGSIKLTVSDLSETSNSLESTSYYRIKESNADNNNDDSVVTFSNYDSLCMLGRTSIWQLRKLTDLLSTLYESKSLKTDLIEEERTLIGPSALLHVIYENRHLFKFKGEHFSDEHLATMYYFVAVVPFENDRKAQIICTIRGPNINLAGEVELDETLLDIHTDSHPSMVRVFSLGPNDEEFLDVTTSGPFDLDQDSSSLTVIYDFVQERSTRDHMGLKLGSIDVRGLFTLPPGAGCSSVSNKNIFFVKAKKFSAIFEAKGIPSKRFIAYDDSTKHLRFDSIGEYKLILDIESKKLTYMAELSTDPTGYESNIGCAQSYLSFQDNDNLLRNIQALEDVLGLGDDLGLMYLGTVLLDDGTLSLVYEREIAPNKIPLIIKLSSRLRGASNNRFFLVYYFVEIDATISINERTNLNYQSVHLERMELTSLSPISRYKIVNSQITFSQFIWDLESMVDDSSVQESRLIHPVRTFDTVECHLMQDQNQLQVLFRENNDISESTTINQYIDENVESLEEAVMKILSKRTTIPRSQIGQLEVSKLRSNNTQYILAKAKLVAPLNYEFTSKLIGWILNIDDIPFSKYGTMVKVQMSIIHHECSLKLAVENKKKEVIMVFCPVLGMCGYIEDLRDLNYSKAEQSVKIPSSEMDSEMCELYKLTRGLDSSRVLTLKFEQNAIKKALENSEVNIKMDSDSRFPKPNIIRTSIIKTLINVGHSMYAKGTLVSSGFCYKNNVQVPSGYNQGKPEVEMLELKFEIHHSLYYCHKACQLYPSCQTYSFSRSTKVCVLSNTMESSVRTYPSELESVYLTKDRNCEIYAINSFLLFKSYTVVMMSSLSKLRGGPGKYYIKRANLNECASLCHTNAYLCNQFKYDMLNSICVLDDPESKIYTANHMISDERDLEQVKIDHFAMLFNHKEWDAIHDFHLYKRDFQQHFKITKGMKVVDVVQSDTGNETDTLTNLNVLYGLTYEECLRECILVQPKCLIVDHCILSINFKSCHMYTWEAINEKTDSLKKLDVIDQELIRPVWGCVHQQLNEDYLMVRLRINFNLTNDAKQLDEADKDQSDRFKAIETIEQTSSSFGNLLLTCSSLIIGLIGGILLSLPVVWMSICSLMPSYQLRQSRTAQSTSKLELNELDEMQDA